MGTPETIAAACAYWHGATGAAPMGALTLRYENLAHVGGVPVLGIAEDAAALREPHAFDAAIVCLPRAMHDAAARVGAALRAAGVRAVPLPAPGDLLGHDAAPNTLGAADPALLIGRP
ncbi:MAG: hypothetical protein EA379_07280, partial [Phycisphaerales bacterium]